jgi:LysM repeat protein
MIHSMNDLKRKFCLALVGLVLALPLMVGAKAQAGAPAQSAWGLIDAVNAVRVGNGLAPYKVNDALMAAAQSQSDYQAAKGVSTHTGKGGSDARGRAIAFGYGGGAAVSVNEAIASGTSMDAQYAANMWITMDALHRNIVLSSSYTDAGAGMATAGGVTYYTLDVGYVGGAAGSPPANNNNTSSSGQPASSAPAAPVIMPVKVAEPQEDGSIVHEVEPGHTLIQIADAYKIPLADLLALNNLTFNSIIYPGQKILIRVAEPSPTPTPQENAAELRSVTPTPRRVLTATQAATKVATPVATATVKATPAADDKNATTLPADPVLLIIGGLIVTGTALLVASVFLRRGGP